MLARQRRHARGHGDERHGDQHHDERQRVDEEHDRGARGGQQQAADRRTDRPREILVDRAERDRLRAFGRRHQLGLERLRGRPGDPLTHADPAQHDQQNRRRHRPGHVEHAETRRGQQHHELAEEDQPLAIEQVAEDAAGDGEGEHRQVGGLDRADQHG